ncbi:hypothetical protein ACFYON_23925 [Micromonospora sp. NPDC005686]|uniref:hypothetical protein n=1 Tax=unclassified Micromonospora TaxID=2617518 RepID=UPI0033A144B7
MILVFPPEALTGGEWRDFTIRPPPRRPPASSIMKLAAIGVRFVAANLMIDGEPGR